MESEVGDPDYGKCTKDYLPEARNLWLILFVRGRLAVFGSASGERCLLSCDPEARIWAGFDSACAEDAQTAAGERNPATAASRSEPHATWLVTTTTTTTATTTITTSTSEADPSSEQKPTSTGQASFRTEHDLTIADVDPDASSTDVQSSTASKTDRSGWSTAPPSDYFTDSTSYFSSQTLTNEIDFDSTQTESSRISLIFGIPFLVVMCSVFIVIVVMFKKRKTQLRKQKADLYGSISSPSRLRNQDGVGIVFLSTTGSHRSDKDDERCPHQMTYTSDVNSHALPGRECALTGNSTNEISECLSRGRSNSPDLGDFQQLDDGRRSVFVDVEFNSVYDCLEETTEL